MVPLPGPRFLAEDIMVLVVNVFMFKPLTVLKLFLDIFIVWSAEYSYFGRRKDVACIKKPR